MRAPAFGAGHVFGRRRLRGARRSAARGLRYSRARLRARAGGGDAEVLVRAIRRAMEDGGGGGGEVLDEMGAEEAEAEEADDGQGAAAAVAHDGEMIDYNAL